MTAQRLLWCVGLWLTCVGVATAEPISMKWNAVTTNTDQSAITDLCCYKIYWGTSSGVYPNSQNVGNVIQATIGGLDPALNYYFVVKAVNTTDVESPCSIEISGRPRKVISW